jgi:hypothetical protein
MLRSAAVILLTSGVLAAAEPALAQAQRTFVSTAGNDANACGATTPCRTFGRALSQTVGGGEIVVLASGGYGAVTVGQSVTITSPSGLATGISVTTPGTDGVTINGANIDVNLRGLAITGLGGANGINIANAASVRVEQVTVTGFTAAAVLVAASGVEASIVDSTLGGSGTGILSTVNATIEVDRTRIAQNVGAGMFADAATRLRMRDSVVTLNGSHGILLGSGGTGQATSATITGSRIADNAARGLRSAPTAGTVTISISDTVFSGNGSAAVSLFPSGTAGMHASLDHVTVASNAGAGAVLTAGTGASGELTASWCTFVDNQGGGIAFQGAGKALGAISDSQVAGNGEAGVFIQADGGGAAATTRVSATRNRIFRNGYVGNVSTDGIVVGAGALTDTAEATLTDNQIADNVGAGIHSVSPVAAVPGQGATAIASGNVLLRNGGVGLYADGGVLLSSGNNTTRLNAGGNTSGTLSPTEVH